MTKKNLVKMWISVITFIVSSVVLLLIDLMQMYFNKNGCYSITSDAFWNAFIWFISRVFALILWMIPIIVIFWKSIRKKRKPENFLNLNGQGIKDS